MRIFFGVRVKVPRMSLIGETCLGIRELLHPTRHCKVNCKVMHTV